MTEGGEHALEKTKMPLLSSDTIRKKDLHLLPQHKHAADGLVVFDDRGTF